MLKDGALIIGFVFTRIWGLFNSFYIPGTMVTPAAIALCSLGVVLTLRIIKIILKANGGDLGD